MLVCPMKTAFQQLVNYKPRPLSVSLSFTGGGHIWCVKWVNIQLKREVAWSWCMCQMSWIIWVILMMQFPFLALTQLCFAGVSEPQARAIVRYNLLHPRKPVLSLKAVSVIDDNQEEIFHLFLGAAAVALLFLFPALMAGVLYYKKRWVHS